MARGTRCVERSPRQTAQEHAVGDDRITDLHHSSPNFTPRFSTPPWHLHCRHCRNLRFSARSLAEVMLLSAPLPRCEPSWTRHHVSQLKPGAIPAVFLSAASQHLVPVPLKAHRPPSALVQAERGWATARDPHLIDTTLVAARQVMVSDSPPSQSRQTANVRPAAAGRVADT